MMMPGSEPTVLSLSATAEELLGSSVALCGKKLLLALCSPALTKLGINSSLLKEGRAGWWGRGCWAEALLDDESHALRWELITRLDEKGSCWEDAFSTWKAAQKVLTWLLKLMNKMGKWDFLWSPSTENSIWPDINYECPQLSTLSFFSSQQPSTHTHWSSGSVKAPLRPAQQQLLVKRRDKQLFPFFVSSRCFLSFHLTIKTFQNQDSKGGKTEQINAWKIGWNLETEATAVLPTILSHPKSVFSGRRKERKRRKSPPPKNYFCWWWLFLGFSTDRLCSALL